MIHKLRKWNFSVGIAGILLLSFSMIQSQTEDSEVGPWDITITDQSEPGEPLVVSGTVFDADGKPLAGSRVYLYHTDIEGYYSKNGVDETNRRLHGTLFTDKDGRYRFRTIKPGAYPNGGPPAHIHFEISAPGRGAQRFDLWFQGDPRLTESMIARYRGMGRLGRIQPLERGEDGVLYCIRDFRLR